MKSGARPTPLRLVALLTALLLLFADDALQLLPLDPAPWSEQELALLRSMWIGSLPPVPPDPSNAVADDPRAATLGQRLFFDVRLSGNGQVACATCHQPGRRFTDGLTRGRAIGESRRNTPSLVGAAYSPWLYWDGRKDSLWAQALEPIEDPAEQGGNRMAVAHLIGSDPDYRNAYQALFGDLPELAQAARFPPAAGPVANQDLSARWEDMTPADRQRVNHVFANVGKAIAAFERTLLPQPSRFDAYVAALLNGDRAQADATFTHGEVQGLRLFIGAARCIECHNGPLLSNNEFHNTGLVAAPGEVPDTGRIAGLRAVRADPFNCLGAFSDDPERSCPELEFARSGVELLGAMRTPSLRNLDGTEPFMHKGQLATLAEVLQHYNRAEPAMIGHNEAKLLGLPSWRLAQLQAFLHTLSSEPAGGHEG